MCAFFISMVLFYNYEFSNMGIMIVKKKIKSHPHVVNCFKELPFYNKHIEKPKIKRLKNIECNKSKSFRGDAIN